jgi:3-oxoacyl-[acyl-carrier-protein] synthase III
MIVKGKPDRSPGSEAGRASAVWHMRYCIQFVYLLLLLTKYCFLSINIDIRQEAVSEAPPAVAVLPSLIEETLMKEELMLPVYIRSFGSWIPERRITNEELANMMDTSDDWIRSHTGIGARHLADDQTSTSDMAVRAAGCALERAGITPDQVDCIVVATATPDYVGFPATACVVQQALGIKKAPAFDVTAGCTGFIFALEIALAFMKDSHMKNILVIGAEKLSSIVDWQDRNTAVLFGDGAGCAVLSSESSFHQRRDRSGRTSTIPKIIDSVLYTDGTGYDSLMLPAGGSRKPMRTKGITEDEMTLKMDGRRVYNFAVKAVSDIISELAERSSLTYDQIDWIVPHQANSRIIQAAARRLKIPMEKFYVNIEDFANTSAASIPIALAEMQTKDILKPGDVVLTVGFGAGLTYGGNLFVW